MHIHLSNAKHYTAGTIDVCGLQIAWQEKNDHLHTNRYRRGIKVEHFLFIGVIVSSYIVQAVAL